MFRIITRLVLNLSLISLKSNILSGIVILISTDQLCSKQVYGKKLANLLPIQSSILDNRELQPGNLILAFKYREHLLQEQGLRFTKLPHSSVLAKILFVKVPFKKQYLFI
jgi:hypothetical protein